MPLLRGKSKVVPYMRMITALKRTSEAESLGSNYAKVYGGLFFHFPCETNVSTVAKPPNFLLSPYTQGQKFSRPFLRKSRGYEFDYFKLPGIRTWIGDLREFMRGKWKKALVSWNLAESRDNAPFDISKPTSCVRSADPAISFGYFFLKKSIGKWKCVCVCVWAQVWHFVLFLFDLSPPPVRFTDIWFHYNFWGGGGWERERGKTDLIFSQFFAKADSAKSCKQARWKLNISEARGEKNNGIAALWQGHQQYLNYPFDLFFCYQSRFHKKKHEGRRRDEMEGKKSWKQWGEKWKRIARQHRGSAKNKEKGKELATTAIKI